MAAATFHGRDAFGGVAPGESARPNGSPRDNAW
jgi:hypothetical protein